MSEVEQMQCSCDDSDPDEFAFDLPCPIHDAEEYAAWMEHRRTAASN